MRHRRNAHEEDGLVRVHARVGHRDDAGRRVADDEVLVRKGAPAGERRRAAAPVVRRPVAAHDAEALAHHEELAASVARPGRALAELQCSSAGGAVRRRPVFSSESPAPHTHRQEVFDGERDDVVGELVDDPVRRRLRVAVKGKIHEGARALPPVQGLRRHDGRRDDGLCRLCLADGIEVPVEVFVASRCWSRVYTTGDEGERQPPRQAPVRKGGGQERGEGGHCPVRRGSEADLAFLRLELPPYLRDPLLATFARRTFSDKATGGSAGTAGAASTLALVLGSGPRAQKCSNKCISE